MSAAASQTPESTQPATPSSDPTSSSSTLVNHAVGAACTTPAPRAPTPAPTSPVSPFSISFDPDASTSHASVSPTTPTAVHDGPTPRTVSPGAATALWTDRLSASFGAIADQIAAASKALASVEVPAAVSGGEALMAPPPSTESVSQLAGLSARLDVIESAQERLAEDMEAVRMQMARLHVNGKEKEIVEEANEEADPVGQALEELQKKVDGIVETIKLDQARLYARLYNATVTANKMTIKWLPMANGKGPQNFPVTKGEFEHLTKERYEALLKSYNQPIKGDTAAKREALREFIGLTPAN
ncbi:hypothetical protein A0H81_05722 [Grifola frondosa]|uniref:Uncharacterized protein n=1 Tax=Grifola frondosa TaxID=5627 RepID=A0A1C7MCR7_GRIFR|nr:hypothetical protein A0H81_05722 [Grifola frondosa]